MSAHESNYTPTSRVGKWFDERLPIARLMHGQFVDFPTPRNLNYAWTFGGILTFCLVAQIVTGIVLAMHYQPSAAEAFNSVDRIRRDVNFGWLIQPMHAVGASMFFIAVYIHIFRGLYYGSYKAPREVLWILGVFILLAMMATAFMGYALPWGQMSFWGVTVITNLFSALDSVWAGLGTAITEWLWGGYAVTGVTLNRFFSLHYLLPFVIFGLVVLHVWALHVAGQNNPTGLDIKSKSDSVPMYPFAIAKDAVGLFAFLIVFAWFVFVMPDYLGHADNFVPANPLVTPPHIVPEWVFVPWLDTSRVRSAKYRPYYKIAFWFFVFTCVALGWLGSKPAEQPYVFWSQFFTIAYFAFFLIALPVLGLIETPKQLPRSITESVLGRSGGGGATIPVGAAAAPEKR